MTATGAGGLHVSAREVILARIAAALGPERATVDVPDLASLEPSAVAPTGQDLVDRFAERVADYRANVTVVAAADAPAAVAAACKRHATKWVGVPDGLDPSLVPTATTAVPLTLGGRGAALAFGQLDALLAVAPLGIAETGTIVFDAGPGQGPRAASLLPDILICVIDEAALVVGVGQAVPRMRAAVAQGGRPLTMVSGPSATSDIELDRVEGVHGPRILEVVVRRSR